MIVFICSIISSVLYRAGGLSKQQPYWIPIWMRRSWVRDWLCPIFCLAPLFIKYPHFWPFFFAYGTTGGAFTTYWDRIFGFDNFWFAGFMLGLAGIPLIFCGIEWWLIFARAIFLAVSWGSWCAIFGNDHVEEHGRGFFAGVSIFILLLN